MKNADMPITFVDEGDPAFVEQCRPMSGLTKREYFAGLAMQGLLGEDVNHGYNARTVAKWSVEQADALLIALEDTND